MLSAGSRRDTASLYLVCGRRGRRENLFDPPENDAGITCLYFLLSYYFIMNLSTNWKTCCSVITAYVTDYCLIIAYVQI